MVNIYKASSKLEDYYSPKVIAELNDTYIKVVKILGDKVPWHNHENSDEVFLILNGTLRIDIKNCTSQFLSEGDLFTIPKGITHKVSSVEECKILLIEKKDTKHTGTISSSITKTIKEQLL